MMIGSPDYSLITKILKLVRVVNTNGTVKSSRCKARES